ncbi:MAG: nucleoside triphosphate pyrophosphohydrolase [bacterium]|nr:nucleoside triphosphate pyrophosphohydrolase [bacterium]
MKKNMNTNALFREILDIVDELRSDKGCPWDKEQNHDSMKSYIVEEAYEVLESIEEKNFVNLKYELGDLLFQIIFHAQLAKEANLFDINEVLLCIIKKMKKRHPHVFGDIMVNNSKEVLANWNKIKRAEKKDKSILEGIPNNMPALVWAKRVQDKAAGVGFDWDNIKDVVKKIEEEVSELKHEYQHQEIAKIEEEFGDLLFSLVNISRFLKIDPELSLRKTIHKFIQRFTKIEEVIKKMKKKPKELTLKELDQLWEKAKIT